jgi:nitrate reductase / nitrite oxidoreductase, alpha subunit
VYVKDGLITWEAQAVDYPSTGPEMPEYEPRGASFSWYECSPLQIKYPYVRGSLLRLFREARRRLGDPVEAWAEIVDDPQKSRLYRRQGGKGGFVRASWDEVVELIAAAHVHAIRRFGPDRCVGFTPIPAMSMASYASGTRFLSLIGGVILSFYDRYADLPPSSPQTFGDQTDAPESSDWWNAGYLIVWAEMSPGRRKRPTARYLERAGRRRNRLVAGTSRKRLMGLEPTTFCMASSPTSVA